MRPRLYIDVGISGHTHHLVGLKNVDLTVAINSDPDAAVVYYCDLGLAGECKEVVPALMKVIQAYSTEEYPKGSAVITERKSRSEYITTKRSRSQEIIVIKARGHRDE